MTWNERQPTTPGWYWYRGEASGQKPVVVFVNPHADPTSGNWEVYFLTGVIKTVAHWDGQWAGPIPMPEE